MLEKMCDFFEKRLDGYDEHMLTCIDSAQDSIHTQPIVYQRKQNVTYLIRVVV